jgi:c-di-GMP-binding flagellar brake protein YcgR
MERRSKSRIDVQLTCCVEAGKAEATPVRAFTENVSRTGMLMLWAGGSPLPKINGKLNLDVLLPENSEFGPRVMRCRTEVKRINRCAEGGHEVGLRVLSMRFIKPGPGSSAEVSGTALSGKALSGRAKALRGDMPDNKGTQKMRDLAAMPVATERII